MLFFKKKKELASRMTQFVDLARNKINTKSFCNHALFPLKYLSYTEGV